jgi:hypothetical protein
MEKKETSPTTSSEPLSTPQASTGESPFFLLHGFDARTILDVRLPQPDVPVSDNPTDYANNLQSTLAHAYSRAYDNASRARSRQKLDYDSKQREITFSVGDYVFLHVPRPPADRHAKLYSPWDGPYRVTDVISPLVYDIVNTENTNDQQRVTVQRLKPAYLPIPIEERVYEVQRILDHRTDPDGNLRFKIHWRHFAKRDATWERLESLDNCTERLHEYLRLHPTLRLPVAEDGSYLKGGASVVSETLTTPITTTPERQPDVPPIATATRCPPTIVMHRLAHAISSTSASSTDSAHTTPDAATITVPPSDKETHTMRRRHTKLHRSHELIQHDVQQVSPDTLDNITVISPTSSSTSQARPRRSARLAR